MEAIVVSEMTSRAPSGRSLHNRVSWRSQGRQRLIVAVGAPEEWNSPAALPPTVNTTDLVAAAQEQPELAKEMWGAFLHYLVADSVPAWHFALPRFLRPPVVVSLKLPPASRAAVSSAIVHSRGPLRFRVTAAA